ncbi:unnamed protein product [Cochlearia groenlandica]
MTFPPVITPLEEPSSSILANNTLEPLLQPQLMTHLSPPLFAIDPFVQKDNLASGSPTTVNLSSEKPSIGKASAEQTNLPRSGLGAWSTPLNLVQPPSAVTILMQTTNDLLSDISSEAQWPSISEASNPALRRRQPTDPVTVNHPLKGSYRHATTNGVEQVRDYPWAAKMDQSKRNLHQVTSPVFLEDGTPKVCVPRHVLLEGLENQKEFVLGQFHRCSAPPVGLVQAIVTRIWGKRCRI